MGRIGRITIVSQKLVNRSRISAPVSRTIACTASSRPWPMNRRTFSTSSVARIMSWPVRLRS